MTTTADSGPGSLRQALLNANQCPGTNTITFAIPGPGPHTIALDSALPPVTDPVVIDGWSEPDFAGTPLIELNGGAISVGNAGSGLTLVAGSSTVRGLVINRFQEAGITIGNGGNNNTIVGNYIGTDVSGTIALPNGDSGVYIEFSSGNRIGGTIPSERNVISGNSLAGIYLWDGANNTIVQGNYIGSDASGSAALANGWDGITLDGAVGGLVGGTASGARNVISGNGINGIYVTGGTINAVIQGNYIGTDATGNRAVPNRLNGIRFSGAVGGIIGGTASGARNVISGNSVNGIISSNSDGQLIQGNYIGLNAAGNAALGNIQDGVRISTGSGGTLIGGTAIEARNVVSGNLNDGIELNSSGNTVQGNWLGTDATGQRAIGNGVYGVSIWQGTNNQIGGTNAGAGNLISASGDVDLYVGPVVATGNTIQGNTIGTDASGTTALSTNVSVWVDASNIAVGGIAPGAGNLIGGSGPHGVVVRGASGTATGVAILGNSIVGHSQQGIELYQNGVAGPTPNDPGDGDSGANQLQNFPTLGRAILFNGLLTIEGTLNATPNQSFRIELFANSAPNPSGRGAGERFLGAVVATTDAAGNAAFTTTLTAPASSGEFISGTATDASGNTSEFGPNVVVDAPSYSISGAVQEDRGANGSVDGQWPLSAQLRLYRDDGDNTPDGEDPLLDATATDGTGNYSFGSWPDGVYWVVADSRSLRPGRGLNSGFEQSETWAEQTFASAGALRFDGTYSFSANAGPLFGGLRPDRSDDAASLADSEHIIRVPIAGADVAGVSFGFSFDAVTHTRDDDDDPTAPRSAQGTLRQFIQNANAVSASNAMRFVPVVAPNVSQTGRAWWRIDLSRDLPPLLTTGTTIDGRAYSAASPSIQLDPNPGLIGTGGTVGADSVPLARFALPELELRSQGPLEGISVREDIALIRYLAINGFSSDIDVGVVQAVFVEDNLLGVDAAGQPAPVPSVIGVYSAGGSTAVVANNFMRFHRGSAVLLDAGSAGWRVEGNEIRDAGQAGSAWGGIWLIGAGTLNNSVHFNLVAGSCGAGIEIAGDAGPASLQSNTLTNNGTCGGTKQSGVRLINAAGKTTIVRNVITNNRGDGVEVLLDSTANRLSANHIFANGGLGIDLEGEGVTPNDTGDGDSGANLRQNFPMLSAATVSGSSVTLSGSLNSAPNATFVIEVFASGAPDPSGHGEGERLLTSFTLTTFVGGNVMFSRSFIAPLRLGEYVSATATDASGNTSEFGPSRLVTAP